VFERFTRDARQVVRMATDAACHLDGQKVTTAHLLIGLVAVGDPSGRTLVGLGLDEATLRGEIARNRIFSLGGRDLDVDALATIGVDYEAVREAVERRFGAGALAATAVRQPPRRSWWRRKTKSVRFSGEAVRVMEGSLPIALKRGDKELRPLHLLLGILADPSCIAVRLIERRGVSIAEVRAALAAQES
jgi:ATP-dependent Clp protease ATP-binding subunit ClpA